MANRKKDEKAIEMYDLYKSGFSLEKVAEAFDCSRQSVYEMFKCRGFVLRSRVKKAFVVFNNNKYTLRNHGYYAKTNGDRNLLHRDVWTFFNGEIPENFDIHHLDENKLNNDINNLECLPKSEHTKLYSPHNNQYTKGRKRDKCGS